MDTPSPFPLSPPGVEDRRLLRRFESLELAPQELDHAAHVRLAWTCLHLEPPVRAIARIAEGLAAFAAHHGADGLYHETITWAYILLVNERIARLGRPHRWAEFAAANPDLLVRGKAALQPLYRDETLASELARRVFVLPDRAAAGGVEAGR